MVWCWSLNTSVIADRYLIHVKADTGTPQSDSNKGQSPSEAVLVSDANFHGGRSTPKEEEIAPSSELAKLDDSKVDASSNSVGSVSALKDLVGVIYTSFSSKHVLFSNVYDWFIGICFLSSAWERALVLILKASLQLQVIQPPETKFMQR